MMAGEIEYENFIYENGEALFGVTGHVMIMGSERSRRVVHYQLCHDSVFKLPYDFILPKIERTIALSFCFSTQ